MVKHDQPRRAPRASFDLAACWQPVPRSVWKTCWSTNEKRRTAAVTVPWAGARRDHFRGPQGNRKPIERSQFARISAPSPLMPANLDLIATPASARRLLVVAVDIDDQRSKRRLPRQVVALVFWGDWCPFCRSSTTRIGWPTASRSRSPDRRHGVRQAGAEGTDREATRIPGRTIGGARSSIATRWRVRAGRLYVLDAKGVIRFNTWAACTWASR